MFWSSSGNALNICAIFILVAYEPQSSFKNLQSPVDFFPPVKHGNKYIWKVIFIPVFVIVLLFQMSAYSWHQQRENVRCSALFPSVYSKCQTQLLILFRHTYVSLYKYTSCNKWVKEAVRKISDRIENKGVLMNRLCKIICLAEITPCPYPFSQIKIEHHHTTKSQKA